MSTMADRLSATDAAFLYGEDARDPDARRRRRRHRPEDGFDFADVVELIRVTVWTWSRGTGSGCASCPAGWAARSGWTTTTST